MIPPLDHRGLLPGGTHTANWAEIHDHFAFNTRRKHLLAGMLLFIRDELQHLASGLSLTIGGSYLSDKAEPGDIDCTVHLQLSEAVNRVELLTLCNEHGGKGRIWHQYGVEIYPSIEVPGAPNFSLFFQYVGEKTSTLKNLHEKDLRGVIEVTPWILG